MTELKPCPFCGSEAIKNRYSGSYGYTPPTVSIKCSKCWCEAPSFNEVEWEQFKGHLNVAEEALNKAIEVWNQRA